MAKVTHPIAVKFTAEIFAVQACVPLREKGSSFVFVWPFFVHPRKIELKECSSWLLL